MERSEAKRKHSTRLSEEEIQNLIEGKDSKITRKATKNAIVIQIVRSVRIVKRPYAP